MTPWTKMIEHPFVGRVLDRLESWICWIEENANGIGNFLVVFAFSMVAVQAFDSFIMGVALTALFFIGLGCQRYGDFARNVWPLWQRRRETRHYTYTAEGVQDVGSDSDADDAKMH